MTDFARLIDPRAVAIVGASADLTRIGGQPVRANLEFGYRGKVYPVNPKYQEIAGVPCYADVGAVPKPCDVAVVAVPAPLVAETIEACGAAGIPFAVVLSAGFGELGERGMVLEKRLREAIESSGVRVIGPNCQGILNFNTKFYGGFGSIFQNRDLGAGKIALVTQSGGFGYAVVGLAEAAGIGWGATISTGNETDVTTLELMEYLLERDDVSMIASYLEGVNDGPRLAALGARAIALRKPIVVWKVGNTATGRRAAASHTGNLTGDYDLYRTVFRTGGFIEVEDVDNLIDVAKAVEIGLLPAGDRVAVISISGGAGVLMADRLDAYGMQLPQLTDASVSQLREFVPDFSSLANPIDVTAQIFNSLDIFARTIRIVRDDPNIDQLVVYNASVQGAAAERIAGAMAPIIKSSGKPIFVAWSAPPGRADAGMGRLRADGVALYPTPGRAAYAASKLAGFAANVRRYGGVAEPVRPALGRSRALPAGRTTLGETAARAFLEPYGIPFAHTLAVPLGQLETMQAPPFGFPVVLKIDAPGLLHKTEAGGVRTGIASLEQLRAAALDMVAAVRANAPHERIEGVLVAEHVSGLETIAGAFVDPVFGPTIVFGLGGIFTETLRDVSRRFAPLDERSARDMIEELRAAPILHGARTGRAYDIAALCEALVRLSWFACDHAGRLAELDLNPLFVRTGTGGVVAADALVVLRESDAPAEAAP